MTIHNTTAEIDGGGIIHQTSCDIFGGDGIHDHACRNVKYLCDNLAMILNSLINMKKVEAINQKTTGKIWTNEMWNPNHLKLVYELFDDKINQYCIDNGLLDRKPKYIQFSKIMTDLTLLIACPECKSDLLLNKDSYECSSCKNKEKVTLK